MKRVRLLYNIEDRALKVNWRSSHSFGLRRLTMRGTRII